MADGHQESQPVARSFQEQEEHTQLRERLTKLETQLDTENKHRPNRAELEKMAGELRAAIKDSENKILRWGVGAIIAVGGAAVAIIKLL